MAERAAGKQTTSHLMSGEQLCRLQGCVWVQPKKLAKLRMVFQSS
jgi:hypothetical protein